MASQQPIKHVADGVAGSITVAALAGWLPVISAALGVVWFAIQITEKVTGKTFSEIIRCAYRRIRGEA